MLSQNEVLIYQIKNRESEIIRRVGLNRSETKCKGEVLEGRN